MFDQVRNALQAQANPERALFSQRYYQPEPGQKKDKFYGGSVPQTRAIAKEFMSIPDAQWSQLMSSDYHEERLCALMILRIKTDKALKKNDFEELSKIKNLYIHYLDYINHWDLVDESAGSILGRILIAQLPENVGILDCHDFSNPENGFPTLAVLSASTVVWHKRIAIVSQFAWIKHGNLDVPLSICKYHLDNRHHYIQKAVGWVLRDIGKHDQTKLDNFIIENIDSIGSISLSYALEKHSSKQKQSIRSLRKNKVKTDLIN